MMHFPTVNIPNSKVPVEPAFHFAERVKYVTYHSNFYYLLVVVIATSVPKHHSLPGPLINNGMERLMEKEVLP